MRIVLCLEGAAEFVRGHEALASQERRNSNHVELEQTRTNSNTPKNVGNDRQNAMNYEEWSKSIELEQTVTLNFVTAR